MVKKALSNIGCMQDNDIYVACLCTSESWNKGWEFSVGTWDWLAVWYMRSMDGNKNSCFTELPPIVYRLSYRSSKKNRTDRIKSKVEGLIEVYKT